VHVEGRAEQVRQNEGDPAEGNATPEISVVVPVFGRPKELARCLRVILPQCADVLGEVLVIDDGSDPPVDVDAAAIRLPLPAPACELRVIRQQHAGIAAARNRGMRHARGRLVIFVDSDVVVAPGFLRGMALASRRAPKALAFQARLVGHPARLVWRIEGARLEATQRRLLRPDGTLTYLNTSAVAVRKPLWPMKISSAQASPGRTSAVPTADLFDIGVRRGEDTLFLIRLGLLGSLPVWVPQAVAEHRPTGALYKYLLRHLRIGYLDTESRRRAGALGQLSTGSERLRFLRPLLRAAGRGPTGMVVFLLAMLAFALEVVGRVAGTSIHRVRGRWVRGHRVRSR
jgi:glycosyltransferase involved in cell wall biosynthesis